MAPFLKSPTARKIAVLAALFVWAGCLWQAVRVFGPTNVVNHISYNSDNAIPVIMANEDRPFTIFSLYYYGEDRWGAWPLLILHLAHWLFSYHWTPTGLFMAQTVWVFVGALVFARLAGRDWAVAGAIYIFVVCLHRQAEYELFELGQPYAWQVTALFFAWFFMRKSLDWAADGITKVIPGWKTISYRLLTFVFSFLAIWSSIAAGPFLFVIFVIETLRMRFAGSRFRLPRYVSIAATIVAAFVLHFAMQRNYNRHGVKHYQNPFHLVFGIDLGHLRENLAVNTQILMAYAWKPLYWAPFAALLGVAGYLLWEMFKRRGSLTLTLRKFFSDELFVLALVTFGVALTNFALVVITDHVRIDNYDVRFLTITNLFAPISGLLVVYLFGRRLIGYARVGNYWPIIFGTVLVVMLIVSFPKQTLDPRYQWQQETAAALAQRTPGGVLMGGYWQTYVFTSLQSGNQMTPVPLEGHENRMPWTTADVRKAQEIIVEYRETQLEPSGLPPAELTQQQTSFKLADPIWYESGPYAFARYVRAPSADRR